MESSSVKLGVVLGIGLAIFTHAQAWGEDWKKYAENEKIHCCYDAESLTHFDGESLSQPSKNIIKVWVKFEYTDIGLTDPVLVKKIGKKIDKVDNSKSLYEINCVERKYRILESMFYSKEGNVLHQNSIPGNFFHSYAAERAAAATRMIMLCLLILFIRFIINILRYFKKVFESTYDAKQSKDKQKPVVC